MKTLPGKGGVFFGRIIPTQNFDPNKKATRQGG